uniref:Prolactin releasing hormone n=1 Tax=Salvator merianae TaxID=96440 RepID=A0A8D0KMP8_SALMN
MNSMRLLFACLLLLDCLVPPYAECRILEESTEIRNPDIDPSWYTGRGIRPVGRFGRRRASSENAQQAGYKHRQACFPMEESSEFLHDE